MGTVNTALSVQKARQCKGSAGPVKYGLSVAERAPESLTMCLAIALTGEAAARDRNAGFIRPGALGAHFCRLKSAFPAKDSGAISPVL